MKITTYQPPPVAPASKVDSKTVERFEASPAAADGVSLSPDARWVNAIKEQVREAPAVRADLVRQTREALANGTYESSVDLDRLVDNLLADL